VKFQPTNAFSRGPVVPDRGGQKIVIWQVGKNSRVQYAQDFFQNPDSSGYYLDRTDIHDLLEML
jgi:hypothetical protein